RNRHWSSPWHTTRAAVGRMGWVKSLAQVGGTRVFLRRQPAIVDLAAGLLVAFHLGASLRAKQSNAPSMGMEADQRLSRRRTARPDVAVGIVRLPVVQRAGVVVVGGRRLAAGDAGDGPVAARANPAA